MREARETLIHENEADLPPFEETLAFLRASPKATVADLLRNADATGRVLVQPRCGVGAHAKMTELLTELEREGQPDVLSVTIDSYTRLKQFGKAAQLMRDHPERLNGYPLVSHGYRLARDLDARVSVPLEIRHGSPDARLLFETAIAAGITSFEGGGICYNLPYSKTVPLRESLTAWRYVDRVCGELATNGVVVDRELFGTLSAVLVPPSISLAFTLLEAMLAAADGVRCLSIAYPQGGNLVQDVAALRAIRRLARLHLPKEVRVYPVLHEYMGPFPKAPREADALILYGGLAARLGAATKVITKTNQEALGIPTAAANAHGIRTTRLAVDPLFDLIKLNESEVAAEVDLIRGEVESIIAPVIECATRVGLVEAIVWGFETGVLDMPFATSRQARSRVIPVRDEAGAIRFQDYGGLAVTDVLKRNNSRHLRDARDSLALIRKVNESIHFFSDHHYLRAPSAHSPRNPSESRKSP